MLQHVREYWLSKTTLLCLFAGCVFGSAVGNDLLGLQRFEGLPPLARLGVLMACSVLIALFARALVAIVQWWLRKLDHNRRKAQAIVAARKLSR